MKLVIGSILYVVLRVLSVVFGLFRWLQSLWFKSLQRVGRDPDVTYSTGPYWENTANNQFTSPHKFERPTSREELLAIVRRAIAEKRHARALGSGHSFSDVALTDDYLIDMHGLDKVLPLEPSVLRGGVDPATLFRVESGITLRVLNRSLCEQKLALVNMGAYDIQTISGAISTGTHGSGSRLGPLCDAVESIELVDGTGELVIIEPSGGITEPARYAARFPDGPRLLVDDDLFYSAVVSMGSMGIVYAYILRVRPQFLLKETRTLKEWNEVRRELLDGVYTRFAHYEVYVNPYTVHGKRWCLETRREETAEPARSVEGESRNPISTLVTRFRFVDRILLWVFQRLSPLTPWFIKGSLDSLSDKQYVDLSFKVFNLGDANHIPAISSELAFGTAPLPGQELPAYLAAVDRLLELAAEQSEHGRWHTSPFSLRFVRASKHYLAPQYGRETCMIEIPFLNGTPGAWDLLRYYERRLAEYGARPHWGQNHFLVNYESTAAAYEKFPAFIASFGRLNPDATFDNSFTQRLSLRTALKYARVSQNA